MKEGQKDMLWQSEDCKLCKEHCPKPGAEPPYDVKDWPKLTYPHPKNPSCVGYCSSKMLKWEFYSIVYLYSS